MAAFAVSVVAFYLVFGLRELGALQGIELRTHDAVKALLADPTPAPDVVIVSIDDNDIGALGWPIPDDKLAAIMEAAAAAGAAAVGVDLYRDRPVGAGADALEVAFTAHSAFGISKLGTDGQESIRPPDYLARTGTFGFSDVPVDDDGVARRALLLVSDADGIRLSFAMQLALRFLEQKGLRPWPEDPSVLVFGETPVPRLSEDVGAYRDLDNAGYQVLVDYTHALPVARMIPARNLVSGSVSASDLAGRVVIIGAASEGAKDYFLTPLNRSAGPDQTLGVQVHAAIVQQLIDYGRGTSRPASSPTNAWQALMVFVAALLGSAGLVWSLRPVTALLMGLGMAAVSGCALASTLVFELWLPALPVTLSWVVASLATFAVLAVIRQRELRAVSKLFASHLSPDLAKEVWRNRDVILKGGKPAPMKLYATVLFVDMAGSTAVGGGAAPSAFMDWVGSFLDAISRIAAEHGGFVEKFTGDGMMVVFGAPLPHTTENERCMDAVAACNCALATARLVRSLNRQGNQLAPYRIRIGIHSGTVYGGTIGSSGTLRYNVMGDTVNVAARIEAFGKRIGDRLTKEATICLSGETAGLASGVAGIRWAGELPHDDGKTIVEVHELTGDDT